MIKKLHLKTLLLIAALLVGSSSAWADPVQLFHETFGNNSNSARNWSDTYSVKSGVSSVYSGASYTVTNAKQSKNTMGYGTSSSALVSGQGATGTFIVGPLNVSNYNTLSVTNYFGMSAGSWNTSNSFMKLSYSTNNSTYTEVSRSGSNPSGAVSSNSNLVQASYSLPTAAQSSTLYLKFEFYCYQVSKSGDEIGQAYFDEVNLSGVENTNPSPSISLTNYSINATSAAVSTTSIAVTYRNLTNYDADVIFYEADGTTLANYDHSWMTATINASTKNLDYSITANTGAARTAYFKVYALGDGDAEAYSELITITQAAYNPAVVTLDFTTNSWGLPTSGTNTSATSYSSGGYTITFAAPNNYYFDTNNVMLGKNGATLTLPAFGFNVEKIKVYGIESSSKDVTFNIFVGSDAVSTAATSSKVDHEFTIAADKRNVGTIYVLKVTNNNNMRFTKIEVFGNGCEAGLVQSYGWATYITTSDVEYPANTAYVVTDASVSAGLTVEAVTQVPTGTPLLLKGAGAKTAILLESAPAAPTTNLLSVYNGSIASGYYPYVLAKDGEGACFKQWTGDASVLNGRVVLLLNEDNSTRSIYSLDDEMTGITGVNLNENQNDNRYYDLQGRHVAQPTKGLYIINGKKVLVK